jgi:hypothetical protein
MYERNDTNNSSVKPQTDQYRNSNTEDVVGDVIYL